MKLQNEFTVGVPLERAWETLLDIERVAGFLPGATIEPGGEDGVYRGAMKVKLGPVAVTYQGTARMAAVDEAERTADIEVQAREAKGQGTAAAVIRNRLISENGRTRVVAETDLQVTGRQAQFGRGIMEDVAGRMLDDFARRFEAYLLSTDGAGTPAQDDDRAAADAAGTSRPAPPPPPADDALDLGSVLSKTSVTRFGAPVAGGLAVLMLIALVRRSRARRGLTVRLELGI